MSERILKFRSPEISITAANNVALAPLIRCFNNTASVAVLTVAYANGTAYANCTLGPQSETFVKKGSTDLVTLASGLAVAVAVN